MPFPEPGGSVLVGYRLDDKDVNGQTIAHGYIREYHLATATILDQLKQMYANGQRRLGLAIAYHAGGDTFALDSSPGALITQDKANLTALIKAAIEIGFGEFVLEMIPEWQASYANWQNEAVMGTGNARAWQPDQFYRNMEFTFDVDATAAAAIAGAPGVIARMDLLGENSNAEYGARAWYDWCARKGGHGGSIGFSMVPTDAAIGLIPQFYTNGIQPEVWGLHPYGGPGELTWSQAKAKLRSLYWQGIIASEVLCNDAATAATLKADDADLFYLLQWPVDTNDPSAGTQNCLTIAYGNYAAAGL